MTQDTTKEFVFEGDDAAKRVLIVDDEDTLRNVLDRQLSRVGCETEAVGSAEQAIESVRRKRPSVVLLDIKLPGMNGLQALGEIKKISPDTEVLIMTSHASVETAIQAIRDGAYDYLQKPFEDLEQVWITVQRALEKRSLTIRNRLLRAEQERRNEELAHSVARLTSMVSVSHAMSEAESQEELLDFFVGFLTDELDVDRASLMVLDEETQQLRIAAHRGLDELDPSRIRVALGEGIAGSVAANGEPLLVENADQDLRVSSPSADLSSSFVSAPIVLSIPLKSSRRVLGVINLTNRRNGQPFEDDDLKYVLTMSSHLAVAIEKNRHLDELKRAYDSLKATQEQLVFSERLKAVGQMAAGVAHDFNNLLSVISGRAELQRARVDTQPFDVDNLRASLDTISKAALQGSRVVERIQNFTRARELTATSVFDVGDAIRSAIEMTRPKWKDEPEANGVRIQLETDLVEAAGVAGNVYELGQAIANLVFNAVEAMPDGGAITIRSRVDDGWAIVQVRDTGSGMDEETQARLFEPFFSTKDKGQGLGTSILNGIVRRHGGRIAVRSELGAGTEFELRLPLAKATVPIAGRADPVSRADDIRCARVLFVDDDDLVRETYQEALRTAGHQVVPCSSGRQALQLCKRMECEVVVTDLGMSEMSGLELARTLKDSYPDLPIILFSGWAGEFIGDRVENSGVDFVLQKPCMIEKLLRTIQDALAQPALS